MNNHPLNLALRFLLELAALASVTVWAYRHFDTGTRLIAAIAAPLAMAVIWAVFRVEGDPGHAPIAIPGWTRLLLETIFFCLAFWALHDMGYRLLFIMMLALFLTHYLVSYDRIMRILE